jgi:hypothetical protein
VTKKDKENRSCLDVGSLEEKLKIAEEALREIKTRTVWRLKTYNHFYVLATNELPWLLERVGELEAALASMDCCCQAQVGMCAKCRYFVTRNGTDVG